MVINLSQFERIDNSRYYGPRWLEANERIRNHPLAALSIVERYPAREWKHARRTAVCAAGLNTPYWQEAVARAYPAQRRMFADTPA